MKDVKGKVCLVTGASQGIGKSIAIEFAKAGCHVLLLARSKDKLQLAVNEIRQSGGKADSIVCDASNTELLRKEIQSAEAEFGSIDILINNAGAGTFKPMHLMSAAEAELPILIPVMAATVASHAVIPGMIKRKSGHIVNLTSPAGYVAFPYMLPYTAARHAMVGLSLGLHDELKKRGIGVTLLCPAQVDTGYFERNDADMGYYPRISKMLPVLKPELVARKTLKAVQKNRREWIFPFSLWILIRFYQTLPRFSRIFLTMFGLYQPSRKIED